LRFFRSSLVSKNGHVSFHPSPAFADQLRHVGEIHRVMSWKNSVLTDSGGFQIFSLPHARSMSEEGTAFQSYLDGWMILLSPELSIQTQKAIGSEIMMVLDQGVQSRADEGPFIAAIKAQVQP
jgi:queuine tRNA-ribosyltransferase